MPPPAGRVNRMIDVGRGFGRLCSGVRRRELLRLGGLSTLGLTLADLLAHDAGASVSRPFGKARSCIFFFQEGGLAHQDTWDLKPDSPSEVRGPFEPIRTNIPGRFVCEHLPNLARIADRYALIRSVSHDVFDHNAGAYYCLTGRTPRVNGGLILGDRRTNFPGYGGVMSTLRPSAGSAPSWVQIPALLTNNGEYLPGQRAGFLGGAHDPFVVGDPTQPRFALPGLTAPPAIPDHRVARRAHLLKGVERTLEHLDQSPAGKDSSAYYRRAFELLTSGPVRAACRLESETQKNRERYGPHHMGQSLLLARRLVEAGVRLVTVTWGPDSGSDSNQCWDTHRRNHHFLKNSLLPPTDQGLAALLLDLEERGLLEETLVVVMGEFGRTPEINKQAGRDHWPHCYSIMLAGGGIQGGAAYGRSDEIAAYPAEDPVSPEDVAATIYAALGLTPETEVIDQLNRPWTVALGQPVRALFR